jgi:membrane associated rhomboid family serine protease
MGRRKLSSTPVVVVTLAVLLVMYLGTGFAANFVPGGAQAYELLLLDAREVVGQGQIWRLLSYGVLHNLADPLHLLLNGLMLWFFGRDIELRFGPGRFIAFLVSALLVGGLCVTAGYVLGIGSPLVLGFSAAVEASVVAWALFNRDAPVLLFFALPMRGIHMLALAVLMWMMQAVGTSGVSASAHFGGMLTGLVTWLLVAKRNRLKLLFMRRGPKLTVVPPKDRWVN